MHMTMAEYEAGMAQLQRELEAGATLAELEPKYEYLGDHRWLFFDWVKALCSQGNVAALKAFYKYWSEGHID